MMRAPLLLISCLALGCAPTLSLRTPAPPAATLLFVGLEDKIDVTQGVAAGFEVWCAWGPCGHVRAVTDAPGVAQVYPAHVGALRQDYGTRNASMIVLVGTGPGKTMRPGGTLQKPSGSK